MKLLLIGPARHGKDTVADILRDDWGLKPQSSSLFCAEHVMMPYFESIGKPYASLDECFADRVNHRDVWHDQIVAYNAEPTRLTREILGSGHDIYVGMRSGREYAASRFLFDHILWVDGSKRGLPPEPITSMQISYDPKYMVLIENSGSLDDLKANVSSAYRRLL